MDMISNVLIALIGIIGTLCGFFLTNYFNERRYQRLKEEENKKIEKKKHNDLYRAFLELKETELTISRIFMLLDAKGPGEDIVEEIRKQINFIERREILNLISNDNLNVKEKNLASNIYSYSFLKSDLELITNLLSKKKTDPKKAKDGILIHKKGISALLKELSEYLKLKAREET